MANPRRLGPISSQGGGAAWEYAGLTAGALNADLVGDQLGGGIDVTLFRWLSLHVNGTWTGTLSFQGSNDNTNWTSFIVFDPANTANIGFSSMSSNRIVHGPLPFRFLRVRMTAYTSGTATAVMELHTFPSVLNTLGVMAQQTGSWSFSGTGSAASPGTSSNHLMSAASTNATSVKASAGRLYKWSLTNTTAALKYVKFYNKASAPTVGTDVPLITVGIPANGTVVFDSTIGWWFSTGIAFAITGAAADNDATAVAANDVALNIEWI